ncbi:Protein DSF2 [Pleurostoma richardsiae]|uniref:Protein DSF2 n=1 Tax=Pleurostoma richardsiae TaxID=41990 RepID=A0AA38R851_9PEZI|nr:Protein DSF2 [Pleurostoma richardsiae]
MGLRDLLKKKDKLEEGAPHDPETVNRLAAPEFTFIRSDTFTQEVIHPPSDPAGSPYPDHDDDSESGHYLSAKDNNGGGGSGSSSRHRSLDVFRSRSRSTSVSSRTSTGEKRESAGRRISQRLHLSRAPPSSENVPQDLPEIVVPDSGQGPSDKEGAESQWEKRATMLARAAGENDLIQRSRPGTPAQEMGQLRLGEDRRGASSPQNGVVSSQAIDADIREAIRLHEEGQLDESTRLFGRLADPKGANNPLSQVLYGLALRHGWGCEPDPEGAVGYLSAAASNAATVESMALQAGVKKGGAAKGELVLAIFELANCFRHGWGIPKDPVAAKQYYETAANLGDTDAMNEVAWCYLEGFGCKKDKYAAAKYYRLAEQNGNKTLGNTWIWKEKYDPGHGKK